MDDITRKIIAKSHLENFKQVAPETCKAVIEETLSKWDSLVTLKGFDEFVGGIISAAQGIKSYPELERGREVTLASVMASRCAALLIEKEKRISVNVEPRPVGGGKTGIKLGL